VWEINNNGAGYSEYMRLSSRGHLTVGYGGFLGVGVSPYAGKLHVDQANPTGGVPCAALDQGDDDQSFINFIGTSAADGSKSITSDTGETAAVAGKVRCEINGTFGWVRIYADYD